MSHPSHLDLTVLKILMNTNYGTQVCVVEHPNSNADSAKVAVRWLAVLFPIQEVPGLNVGLD
jgi:hypothetical protein